VCVLKKFQMKRVESLRDYCRGIFAYNTLSVI
jgi:hypothetical protein